MDMPHKRDHAEKRPVYHYLTLERSTAIWQCVKNAFTCLRTTRTFAIHFVPVRQNVVTSQSLKSTLSSLVSFSGGHVVRQVNRTIIVCGLPDSDRKRYMYTDKRSPLGQSSVRISSSYSSMRSYHAVHPVCMSASPSICL